MAKKKDKVIEMFDRYLDLLAKPKDERTSDEVEELRRLDMFLTGGQHYGIQQPEVRVSNPAHQTHGIR